MSKQILEVENAKVFLDVVFGVVLGLPIAIYPKLVHDFVLNPSLPLLTGVVLLSAALTFCAFYWLEVRRFIEEQNDFNAALRELGEGPASGGDGKNSEVVTFTAERFVGSLGAIIFAAAALKYAELNLFRSFLVVNIGFWALDFLGNVEGNKIYKAHKSDFDKIRRRYPKYPNQYSSYVGRFGTFFFWWDGIVTVLLFAALLALDYKFSAAEKYRVAASVGIFIMTIFRHLFWRTRVYDWWKKKKYTAQQT